MGNTRVTEKRPSYRRGQGAAEAKPKPTQHKKRPSRSPSQNPDQVREDGQGERNPFLPASFWAKMA